MEKNMRLFLSMSVEDVDKLDRLRGELGMNRSQYVRYLLSGQKKIVPATVRNKKVIDAVSRVELELRVLALKEEIGPGDVLTIFSEIKEIEKLLVQWTKG